MRKKQYLVLYIGHPFDLSLFKRLIPLINKKGRYYIISIVVVGSYFREMECLPDILNSIADENILIPHNHIPGYDKTLYRLLFVNKLIHKIDKEKSILLSVDKSQFIANYLNSHFKNVILIQAYEELDLVNDYQVDYYRMIFFNLINLVTGSKLVRVLYNRKSKGHIWHYQIIKPHFKILYISNKKSLHNKLVLPMVASPKKSNKIIIFGSRYNEWKYIEPKRREYKQIIFEFYEFLNKKFIDYKVFYKPHPREQGSEFKEINNIFNKRLINVGISLNSELFLIENNDIQYCFSLGSTSSRSAYEMGFSSKVFYKMLSLDGEVERTFDNIFNLMPRDFFINNLDDRLVATCQTSYESSYHALEEYLDEMSDL